MPGITRVLSNAAPLLIIFGFSKLIPIPELGELNYFLALITLIGVFTDFGLPETIQRYVNQKSGKKYISTTIVLEFVIVLIAAVLVILIDLLTNNAISREYRSLIPLIIIFSASNTFGNCPDRVDISTVYCCRLYALC